MSEFVGILSLAVGISWLISLFAFWLKGSFEYDLKYKWSKQLVDKHYEGC